MTQEEKQLLLRDLCGRLPYGVKARIVKRIQDDSTIKDCTILSMMWMVSLEKRLEDVKPYLRQLSSMTEKEKVEWFEDIVPTMDCDKQVDFYNKYHFDYRGLIEKGLALEAPEEMYK